MATGDHNIDALIERAIPAHRDVAPDGTTVPHPAWADLAPADRERLHQETLRSRLLEGVLAGDGLSSTVQRVLRRIAGTA